MNWCKVFQMNNSHLSFCRRLDVRISGFADNIINLTKRTLRNSREVGLTVGGEVTVHLPGSAKICRSLNQHGCWTESLCTKTIDSMRSVLECFKGEGYFLEEKKQSYLKCHDEMSKVKLCLQVQLKVNVRLPWEEQKEFMFTLMIQGVNNDYYNNCTKAPSAVIRCGVKNKIKTNTPSLLFYPYQI